MNNNTFSLSRFGAYLRAELYLQRITILRTLAVVIGISAIASVLLLHLTTASNGGLIAPSYPQTLSYIASIFIASVAFSIFRKPGGGTFAMQMPVSLAEKYGVRLLGHIIITPLLAVLIPRVVWSICYAISGSEIPMLIGTYEFFWDDWTGLLLVQSTFFLGCVVFRKQPFIKTIIAWSVFLMVIITIIYTLKNIIINSELGHSISDFINSWSIHLALALTLVFVTLSWFRFRKLQILK